MITQLKAAKVVAAYPTRYNTIAVDAISESAAIPTSRNPACPMLEYASSRFMLLCEIAMTFPTVMVRAAIAATIGFQSSITG